MAFQQRNYPRVDINNPVLITVENHVLENADCVNISMGGMCVNITGQVKEQQKGYVEITYESEDGELVFKGEFTIRWIKKLDEKQATIQFGLQFTYYDYQNLTNLARIIVSQLNKNQVENPA